MNKKITAALSLALVTVAGLASELEAQRPGRQPQARPPAVEDLLRMRDRLELTEEQVASLREIREEAVARRLEKAQERIRLGSQIRSGEFTREELRERRKEAREGRDPQAVRSQIEARRERVEGILTEQQRELLSNQRRQQARRGQSMRGGNGPAFRRGARGSARSRGGPGARGSFGRGGPPGMTGQRFQRGRLGRQGTPMPPRRPFRGRRGG